MHPNVRASDLVEVLQARGLGVPSRIEPVGNARAIATWRLQIDGADPETWYLHLQQWSGGWDPLATAGAALRHAYGVDGLPVVDRWYQPATHLLGRPSALCPALAGEPGDRFIRKGPQGVASVGRAMGQAMARLDEAPVPYPALQASAERGFLPSRSTWADAWRQFSWLWWRQLGASGTGLGPLSDRLMARVEHAAKDLSTARRWVLVHRDLHPGNVLLADDGSLSGVIDWTGALLGDPVVEWTQPIMLPMPLLAQVVEGYGTDRARSLFDEEAIARLEIYLATRALARLAMAGAPPWYGDAGRTRASGIELAQQTASRVLEPGWVAQRVSAMLNRTAAPAVPRALDPVRVTRRRALDRLRLVPEPSGTGVVRIIAVLALTELTKVEPVGPLLQRAADLLRTLEPPQSAQGAEPIDARVVWRAALLEKTGGHGEAALLAGLALAAVDQLDGTVDDAVLRGIEAATIGQRLWDARQEAPSGPLRFMRALLAESPDPAELADAWDALYAADDGGDLPSWNPAEWVPGSLVQALLPAVRLALHRATSLPASPGSIWRALT